MRCTLVVRYLLVLINSEEKEYGLMKVKCKAEQRIIADADHIMMRVFDVSHTVEGGTIECVQLHYKTWPDHGAPSADEMKEYVELMHQYRHLRAMQPAGHKSIIHWYVRVVLAREGHTSSSCGCLALSSV